MRPAVPPEDRNSRPARSHQTGWQSTAGDRRPSALASPPGCIDVLMWQTALDLLTRHGRGHACVGDVDGCPTADICRAGFDVAQGLPTRYDQWWWNQMAQQHPHPVRMVAYPTTDPARVHPALRRYLHELQEHCPPLGPARDEGHLLLSSFQPRSDAAADVFARICVAAEGVRIRRRTGAAGHASAVLAWLGFAAADRHDDLIAYPAHLARLIYARAAITIADFAPGPPRPSRHDRPVPAPPIGLVVIRVGVAADRDLLGPHAHPALIPSLTDFGGDVIACTLGIPRGRLTPTEAYQPIQRHLLSTIAGGAPIPPADRHNPPTQAVTFAPP